MNVRQTANMLQVPILSGMLHQVAFSYRYLYGIRELKRRLFKGDTGEPYVRFHCEVSALSEAVRDNARKNVPEPHKHSGEDSG